VVIALLVTSIVLSFMLQENIENDINKVNIKDELEKAVADVNAMNQWDDMQARYTCCGGVGNSGFHDWEKHLNGTYPDSCCTVRYPGCGKHAHRSLETDFKQTVYERLHVKGCFTAIKQVFSTFVLPMMLCWSVLALILLPVLIVVTILSVMGGWYLRKLEKSGVRMVSESPVEHCPVHGGKKSSTGGKTEDKNAVPRHSRHSRSRNDH